MKKYIIFLLLAIVSSKETQAQQYYDPYCGCVVVPQPQCCPVEVIYRPPVKTKVIEVETDENENVTKPFLSLEASWRQTAVLGAGIDFGATGDLRHSLWAFFSYPVFEKRGAHTWDKNREMRRSQFFWNAVSFGAGYLYSLPLSDECKHYLELGTEFMYFTKFTKDPGVGQRVDWTKFFDMNERIDNREFDWMFLVVGYKYALKGPNLFLTVRTGVGTGWVYSSQAMNWSIPKQAYDLKIGLKYVFWGKSPSEEGEDP